jgi:hypothetical protein
VSDSGSEMGAAVLRQVRPDAAIGSCTLPLTCADAPDQQSLTRAYLVRDEEAAG